MNEKHHPESVEADVVIEAGKASVIVEERKRDYLLPISILVAGIMVSGSILYLVGSKNAPANTGGTPNVPSAPTPTPPAGIAPKVSASDAVLGSSNAPVTVIEYGDYQCPFCGQFFSGAEAQIRTQYVKTGKVKLVFKNFAFLDRRPGLPSTANESHDAAAAADCAKDQGKFWEFHDLLYQSKLKDAANGEDDGFFNRALFLGFARSLNLDANAFASCFDSGKYKTQIDQDTADAQAAGVNSTPTIFVNSQQFLGALPFAQFQTAIEGFLKAK